MLFLKFLRKNSIDPVTGSYLRRYKDIFRLEDLALIHVVFEAVDYIVNNFKRKNYWSSSNKRSDLISDKTSHELADHSVSMLYNYCSLCVLEFSESQDFMKSRSTAV